MVSESSYHLLSFNTLIHMITIKLCSSNYLLCKSQLLLLLESQDMVGYVDGTMIPPPRFKLETSSNDFFVSCSPLSPRKSLLLSLVSPLHVMFSLRWKLCSTIIRKLVNWDSRMTCSWWNMTPNLLLSMPVPSKQFVTNFMQLTNDYK